VEGWDGGEKEEKRREEAQNRRAKMMVTHGEWKNRKQMKETL